MQLCEQNPPKPPLTWGPPPPPWALRPRLGRNNLVRVGGLAARRHHLDVVVAGHSVASAHERVADRLGADALAVARECVEQVLVPVAAVAEVKLLCLLADLGGGELLPDAHVPR